jgi:hypothetical protein
MKTDPQHKPAIHNPDRKPQTSKDTTLVRQQTNWGDGWDHNPQSILRGARPEFDRACPKPPPVVPNGPVPVTPCLPET